MSTLSRKNFKDMTMLEPKEYLQACVTVTGYLKSSLVQIANAVQSIQILNAKAMSKEN